MFQYQLAQIIHFIIIVNYSMYLKRILNRHKCMHCANKLLITRLKRISWWQMRTPVCICILYSRMIMNSCS